MAVDEHCDVLIIGAGATGIGAARRLLEESNDGVELKVVVLEARNRPGGRAWTSDELQSGIELDHGAKWIHGSTAKNPTNPMMELAAQHGVATTAAGRKRPGEVTRVVVEAADGTRCSLEPGRIHHQAATRLYKQLCQIRGPQSLIRPVAQDLTEKATYKDCLTDLAQREMPGQTFEGWLTSRAKQSLGQNAKESDVYQVLALLRLKIYEFFENYEGCRLDQISLQYGLSGTILPGGNADVQGGYGKLVQAIATSIMPSTNSTSKTIDIRYNQCATSVNQTSDGTVVVSANTTGGHMQHYKARLGCICAVPLSVLQYGSIVFNPPLPERLNISLNRLAMCLMNKISILFPECWWPKGTGELNLVSWTPTMTTDDFPLGDIPWANWVVEEDDPAILVCYATGAFAERMEAKSNEELQTEAMLALRSAFSHQKSLKIGTIPDPISIHATRWRSDPLAGGSWTFFPAGTAGLKDVSAFQHFNAENDRKLCFAGEHTCDGSVGGLDIGTVHGALISGRKAAAGLLRKNHEKLMNS